MVTGDNLLTAMSVARECGIIRPNKRAFILEARDTMANDGRTLLVLKQSISSSNLALSSNVHLFQIFIINICLFYQINNYYSSTSKKLPQCLALIKSRENMPIRLII
jgi:magnesium-transporting ATPase (P-type)